jgi:hypothetical protein
MHDSRQARECLRVGLMRKECFARSAVRRLMPHQNRFGAADREWADRMVTF